MLNAEGKRKNYRWERGSVPDAGDSTGSRNTWQAAITQAGTVLDHLPELLPEVVAGRISPNLVTIAPNELLRPGGSVEEWTLSSGFSR